MDPQKLTDLLRSTIDPNPERRKAAEEQLAQVSEFSNETSNVIGFFSN